MIAVFYNQGNGGNRKSLCPGAPEGPAWHQRTLECSYIYRSWDDEEQQKKKKKKLSKSTRKPRTQTKDTNILEAK